MRIHGTRCAELDCLDPIRISTRGVNHEKIKPGDIRTGMELDIHAGVMTAAT